MQLSSELPHPYGWEVSLPTKQGSEETRWISGWVAGPRKASNFVVAAIEIVILVNRNTNKSAPIWSVGRFWILPGRIWFIFLLS